MIYLYLYNAGVNLYTSSCGKDVENDTEVSPLTSIRFCMTRCRYSALLLAFEQRQKDLHRKIAKRRCEETLKLIIKGS